MEKRHYWTMDEVLAEGVTSTGTEGRELNEVIFKDGYLLFKDAWGKVHSIDLSREELRARPAPNLSGLFLSSLCKWFGYTLLGFIALVLIFSLAVL